MPYSISPVRRRPKKLACPADWSTSAPTLFCRNCALPTGTVPCWSACRRMRRISVTARISGRLSVQCRHSRFQPSRYDCGYEGEVYTWSKHHEFLKILDLPARTDATLELAMGLSGVTMNVQGLLRDNGWTLVDAYRMSLDPWPYRDYIRGSAAELSVAKDMVVRLRSGWFSERSACYLAAGRPVVTQDTGFSRVLPTGEGLFAFQKIDDIVAAIDAINSDYERHSRAAGAIAEHYFRAEAVLAKVLDDLGL